MNGLSPLRIGGKCVNSDEELFGHIRLSLERHLPEVERQEPAHDGAIAIVASGPRLKTQLETLREVRASGSPIVAVRGAHDWLIDNGITPDFAVTVDPLENS